VTALYVLVSVGTLLSGLAAIGQLVTRWHLQRLRHDVNGQSKVLVATAHQLGITEGTVQAQADAFERGDTRGTT